MDRFPENSLSAIKEAIRLGVHMVEFDTRMSKDGHPMVIHDKTLDRLTNGTGRVRDYSAEVLKQFVISGDDKVEGGNERIATLEEVLRIIPTNVWVNIHVKDSLRKTNFWVSLMRYFKPDLLVGFVERVTRIIVNEGMLHQAFLTTDINTSKHARSIDPRIQICVILRNRNVTDESIDAIIKSKAQFVQLSCRREANEQQIRRLKEVGIKTTYVKACTLEDLDRLYRRGINFPLVDNIYEITPGLQKLNTVLA